MGISPKNELQQFLDEDIGKGDIILLDSFTSITNSNFGSGDFDDVKLLPNSELMKKIICLESEQLSYGMVRKNIFSDQSLQLVNETITSIRKKYSKIALILWMKILNRLIKNELLKSL